MKPILITCYVSPDLDGLAGITAYAEFLTTTGRPAVAGIIGEPHDEAKYLLAHFNIPSPTQINNADDYDQVILVDSSELSGLEGKVAPEKVIEIIDHRKVNEADKFPNAKIQIELVGAAATLITEKLKNNNFPLSKNAAILLSGAIISNTFNFRAGLTTERDRAAAAWLNDITDLPADFWRELFLAKSDLSGDKLQKRMEGDLAWFMLGGKKVGIAQIEIIGAHKLVAERTAEIVKTLDKIKAENGFDIMFQNTVELDDVKNFFVANDEPTKKLLEKVLDVKFVGNVAERPNLIMRKQIVPLLKEELEKI